jgi:mono/diheme cytochrome c family protein
MTKKTFIVFGLVVVVLAVLIPWLAFRSDGDAARGAQEVPADLESGQSLFQTNCGTCHTLYAAGTDGNYGQDAGRHPQPRAGEGSLRIRRPHRRRGLAADHPGRAGTPPGWILMRVG